jgi:hypothetical protein
LISYFEHKNVFKHKTEILLWNVVGPQSQERVSDDYVSVIFVYILMCGTDTGILVADHQL